MQVSIPEAARLLRLSEYTVRRRLRTGELHGEQVSSPGGYTWMVQLDDELAQDNQVVGAEMAVMRALVARLEAQVDAQAAELESRRREVQELHVLLQQAQTALSALSSPSKGRPWWRWWRRD
jgi:hypothetical protein